MPAAALPVAAVVVSRTNVPAAGATVRNCQGVVLAASKEPSMIWSADELAVAVAVGGTVAVLVAVADGGTVAVLVAVMTGVFVGVTAPCRTNRTASAGGMVTLLTLAPSFRAGF